MKTAVRFTWNQLRIFDAVARHASHTRAAAELHVVQPTISAQIKQLTDAVGMPLFEQIGKKIFLTPAGRELHATCGELFDCWSRFEMKVADIKGVKTGTLRVAIVTTAKYFTPSGVCIHDIGITPDIVVEKASVKTANADSDETAELKSEDKDSKNSQKDKKDKKDKKRTRSGDADEIYEEEKPKKRSRV